MSRNLSLFLGASVVFYLIGAVNASPAMYAMSAAAVAVILACYSLTRFLIRGLEANLTLEDTRTWPDGTVEGRLALRHLGQVRRSGLLVAIEVGNQAAAATPGDTPAPRRYEFALPPLPPRSRMEFALRLDWLARGPHRVSAIELSATDPLGMFRRPRALPCDAEFLGMPRLYRADDVTSWDLLSPEARRAARRRQISGGEFRGIRPHVIGDDLRHVHWKVTAHTGELVVKEFQHREEAEVALWLDMAADAPWSGPSPDEPGAEPAAPPPPRSLLDRALEYVTLAAPDAEGDGGPAPAHPSAAGSRPWSGGLFHALLKALGLSVLDDEDDWEEDFAHSLEARGLETRISLAASLLSILVRSDFTVSLAGQGLPPSLLPPSRGDAYLDRALVALAEAGPAPGPAFGAFCQERERRSHRLEHVFVLASGLDPRLPEVLRDLALRGASPVVFLAGGGPLYGPGWDDLATMGVPVVRVHSQPHIPEAIGLVAEAVAGNAEVQSGVSVIL
jgi:uncharacterized protein (DUF58 family)